MEDSTMMHKADGQMYEIEKTQASKARENIFQEKRLLKIITKRSLKILTKDPS
jgi:hypothetical protein